MPFAPCGMTWAETALEASVMRVTSAVPPVTRVILPARPPEAITGWSIFTPSLLPLSTFTLEYQTVGERAITRAATGFVARGEPPARARPAGGAAPPGGA